MDYLEMLSLAHNAVCPVCGAKASFVITGNQSFKTEYCHEELNDIVNDRLDLIFRDHIHPDNYKPI